MGRSGIAKLISLGFMVSLYQSLYISVDMLRIYVYVNVSRQVI